MNIQQLHNFVAVARHLNFSEAAKSLFIAQSALSHSIAALEAELNVKLFYRDTRLVKLTPAGSSFFQEVQEIIDRLDRAVEQARRMNAGLSGHINIGFLGSLLKSHFHEWIPPFQDKCPSIGLTFEQMYMAPLRKAIEQGHIDIGFTRSFDLIDSSDLQWIKLYDENISLVMRKDHPLAESPVLDFGALAQESFIITAQQSSPHWYQKVIQICASRGFKPNFVYTPITMEAVGILIESGFGITFFPNSAKIIHKDALTFIPLKGEDTVIDVVAAWKKNNPNPAAMTFLNEITAQTMIS
ncbi:MAG: LysR family transcriptional regulator [Peptococcaceae bacterium]|jgi:DNA-binding transcriptional LysR family regulator|nr:LysR family transcriptional regulator [Peptococcaceae bacterium]